MTTSTEAKLERITPAKAQQILNSNTVNRALREGVVEKYASDMLAGKWTQCTAPIAFYEDGELADGQHRLYAIVESGVAQKFFVVYGLKREDGLNIDTGLNRTLVDNGRISGQDLGLSTTLIAVARGMAEGKATGSTKLGGLSNAAKLEMVEMHREAAHWAAVKGPRGRGIRNGPVLSAIGRAWYLEADKERLARFCTVLDSGFSNGDYESAAVALRNYLTQRKGVAASSQWRDTFLKAMNAIQYFMRGKKLTVIKAVVDEAYPLPKTQRIASVEAAKKKSLIKAPIKTAARKARKDTEAGAAAA